MRDENGNHVPHLEVTVQPKHACLREGRYDQRPIVPSALLFPIESTLDALAREIAYVRKRRAVRREIDRATFTPIHAAPDRVAVRITGRVRLLQPVAHPRDERRCAAYAWSERKTACPSCRGRLPSVRTRTRCGVFLVEDRTGTALVDEDFFDLLDHEETPHRWTGDVDLAVHDEDEVTVVGFARWLPAPAVVRDSMRSALRQAPRVLAFEGRSVTPVRVVAPLRST